MNEQEQPPRVIEQTVRDAWQRPELRLMEAGKAEASPNGLNVDGGFS